MKEAIWYLNGHWRPARKTKISLTDLGLGRGWGVFDYLRTYRGRPFKLSEHLQRFFRSAKSAGLTSPADFKMLEKLVFKILRRNGGGEWGIKIILTAGESADGITPKGKPTLALQVLPLKKPLGEKCRRGMALLVTKERRFLPETKSLDYLVAMTALEKAKKQGLDDVLFIGDKSEVLEATRSNFFAFFGDTLLTAKNDILNGITRETVIDLAKKRFKVREGKFYLADLRQASEAFITNSSAEIFPVVKVGKTVIGNGRPGERTGWLMAKFHELTTAL